MGRGYSIYELVYNADGSMLLEVNCCTAKELGCHHCGFVVMGFQNPCDHIGSRHTQGTTHVGNG